MAYTQTLVATIAVLVFIIVTLALNEGVYLDSDLNTRLDVNTYSDLADAPKDCRFTRATTDNIATYGLDKYSVEDDIAREYLYGGFSARASVISAVVLSLGAFVIAVVAPDLDFDQEAAKYKGGSWFHEGDTKTFVAGVLFRLMVVGAILSMSVATLCSFGALNQQGYVPSAGLDMGEADTDPRALPTECEGDDIGSVVHRSDSLKASTFFSALSVFSIAFMAYAVKYDKKASAE
tara:strand:- start:1752 stop:2456 length:705 start_codon:yes stop_codon:yes gene_type:complete